MGAQGLVGPGVLLVGLLYWSLFAMVPAGLLLGAFLVKPGDDGGRRPLAWLLATPAILYVPVTIPWVFVPDAAISGKLCAVSGFTLLHGLIAFALRRRRGLERGLQVATGVVFLTLLAIPTAFWERPLLRLRSVRFENNLAGLDAQGHHHVAYTPSYWLALEDGRRLFQTGHPDARRFAPPRSLGHGAVVVLEPVPSPDGQERFALTFFDRTPPYQRSMQAPEPRLTIPLLRVRADMYEPNGSRSFAVLLDRDTQVDYVAELVTALERGGDMSSPPRDQAEAVWQSWVRTFVDLGGIDIESPAFLDRAFASKKLQLLLTLLRMGMDPDAVDSKGDTALHVAARNDSDVFASLFQFAVDADRPNRAGRTPLQEARRRYAGGPQAWRMATMERVVDEWRSRRR